MPVEPPPVEPAPSDPLTLLVSRLRDVGVEPDPEELADALWLAQWVPDTTVRGPDTGTVTDVPPLPEPQQTPVRPAGKAAPAAQLRAPTGEGRQRTPAGAVELTVPGADGERVPANAVPVWVPTAVTFPDPQSLQRALSPLRRFRTAGRGAHSVLDERATAERTADTGLMLPILRPSRRREARLRLVMDVSTSMVVWEDAFAELREICERAGAFREVRPHFLREGPDGAPALATAATGGAALRPAAELRDPTGHQVILVFSDCVGPMWRDGGMQRLLHGLARNSPVAVVQPLPQRHWRRTHLPADEGELRRCEGAAGRLEFRSARGAGLPPEGALAVPIIAPRPGPLGSWVHLVGGGTEQRLRAAAGWVRADHPASASARGTDRVVPPRDRVRAFVRTASASAVRLVGHLAAAPLVLPVMRLVQRAMLPGSGPEVLAEVLVGGLLRRAPDVEGLHAYEFAEGVRAELLRRSEESDLHLVLKHCSRYVEHRYGRTARNFPALAAAHLEGRGAADHASPLLGADGVPQDPMLRAFARVSAEVMGRFGAGPTVPLVPGVTGTEETGTTPAQLLERARRLAKEFEENGSPQVLDDAAELFRHLRADSGFEGADVARIELGDVLLQRWLGGRRPGDLLEAYDCVRADAEDHPVAALTYARVLEAMADEELRSGPGSAVLPGEVRGEVAQLAAGEPELANLHRLRAALAVLRLLEREDATLVAAFERLAPSVDAGSEVLLRTLGVQRVGALRRLALVAAQATRLTGQDEGAVDAAFGGLMARCVEWLDELVLRLEQVSGPQPDPDLLLGLELSDLHLLRGLGLLDLARRDAGRGPQPRPPDLRDPRQQRELAGRAVVDLERVLAPRAGASGASGTSGLLGANIEAGELAVRWLDLAEAHELTVDPAESLLDPLIAGLAALDQAIETSVDPRQLSTALANRAFHLWRYGHLLGPQDSLAQAVADLDRALELVPEDAGLHTLLGQLLLDADGVPPGRYGVVGHREAEENEEDEENESPGQLDRCVRAFRAALDLTAASDPEAPRRHLLFAVSLISRYRHGEALSDLHEADWALGVAMREGDDEIVAYAALHRGRVADALARRTGAHRYRVTAADHYRRCVEEAEQLGFATLAVEARIERSGQLMATAGRAAAVNELERAHRKLTALDAGAGTTADDADSGERSRLHARVEHELRTLITAADQTAPDQTAADQTAEAERQGSRPADADEVAQASRSAEPERQTPRPADADEQAARPAEADEQAARPADADQQPPHPAGADQQTPAPPGSRPPDFRPPDSRPPDSRP
ncbi:SAV_2336 N-terminal domain-related protein [Streptomyces cavernicola]|uniref:SAV_2336 N-terminal domain-related protein n=1 Tax=Streptomyces cavernicola TaxID=3043613 RepID=A0ABT6S8Y6_9ACTN|nr:SAV_2336 N-terminal domain-related protein [Streptomyces sp. B-S-A6]MDI3404568.1 SAV_2336 N-terminal domain-related protein [Streptomyces sp. B-S-A6]